VRTRRWPGRLASCGLLTGSCPDIVYVEHLTNAHYLDKRDDVNAYLYVMDGISTRAAPPRKTVDILHKILKES
jgi:hypothetical protein